jgi:hypothetical protein
MPPNIHDPMNVPVLMTEERYPPKSARNYTIMKEYVPGKF